MADDKWYPVKDCYMHYWDLDKNKIRILRFRNGEWLTPEQYWTLIVFKTLVFIWCAIAVGFLFTLWHTANETSDQVGRR